jgi:soluble lytic murein transglycosylase-like protein
LVVFTHGGFMKVAGFAVEGDSVRLDVLSGGAMRVPLLSVERILEDERPTASEPEVPMAPAFEPYFHPDQGRPTTPFGDLIYETAQRHSLNPALVAAVVKAESAFNRRAVSSKGAQGLMQLMPATGHRFGLAAVDAFDPAKNLDAGVRYLRWLIDRFQGRLTHAIAAYNAGEGAVDRHGGVPPYGETRRYLRRIYTTLGLPLEELGS